MSQQETYLQVRASLPCYLSFTFTATPARLSSPASGIYFEYLDLVIVIKTQAQQQLTCYLLALKLISSKRIQFKGRAKRYTDSEMKLHQSVESVNKLSTEIEGRKGATAQIAKIDWKVKTENTGTENGDPAAPTDERGETFHFLLPI